MPVKECTSPQTAFALQREALFRARRVIFSSRSEYAEPPTEVEERSQEVQNTQIARSMLAALDAALRSQSRQDLPGILPEPHREYWEARAPAIVSFGARSFMELARLSSTAVDDVRLAHAAAVFQLSASFLDWLADTEAEGREVRHWLPPGRFGRMSTDVAFRRRLVDDAHSAKPATTVFLVLLGVLFDTIAQLPYDTSRLHELILAAYEAELASFPPFDPMRQCEIAERKSVAPTRVVGELARLATNESDNGVVWKTTSAVAPVFGAIDDIADLLTDLTCGHVNTLCGTPADLSDVPVELGLRTILDRGIIEETAADVGRRLRQVDDLLETTGVDAARRAATSAWLRTIIWRWLS